MPRISIIMVCQNNENVIEPALKSASWADEIVVVDAMSSDRTPDLARQYADQFIQREWRGFTDQKRYATSLARNDWVFILDSDEEISPHLAEEIQSLSDEALAGKDLFEVPRRNYVMGRPVRAWWPDCQSRLFHRERCQWAEEVIHDRRYASKPGRTATLKGWLEHRRHVREGFHDFNVGRINAERLYQAIKQMHDRGKRAHWWDLVFRPAMAFIKSYFLKRGFLDGLLGFMVARQQSRTTYLRYAGLWAMQHGIPYRADQGHRPPGSWHLLAVPVGVEHVVAAALCPGRRLTADLLRSITAFHDATTRHIDCICVAFF